VKVIINIINKKLFKNTLTRKGIRDKNLN